MKEILDRAPPGANWMTYESRWRFHAKKPMNKPVNRETLARFFVALGKPQQAWTRARKKRRESELPRIVAEDGFLHDYALGIPLSIDFGRKLIRAQPENSKIEVEWNDAYEQFFAVVGVPPGFLSKFSPLMRKKKDRELLRQVSCDLALISTIENHDRRRQLSLAVLSHGAAYREIDGVSLLIPSFVEKGKLISYKAKQHLIAEGVKTISLFPEERGHPGLYLCQGTEMWPSQPAMLGSVIANFAIHGSATDAYRHGWRRIHKHLRSLKEADTLPIVAGHSMGGAMAMQIALYSHDLIDLAFASNPPLPNDRDYAFYRKMQAKKQEKLHVMASIDDFAFWRIGSKVIGQVEIFLGKRRWPYYPIRKWEVCLLFPACWKLWLNILHAFPAHQYVIPLSQHFVSLKLSEEQLKKENKERTKRFDYIRFLPSLYDPAKWLLRLARKLYGRSLRDQFIRSELELIALHESELLNTQTEENRHEIEFELGELRYQKRKLLRELNRGSKKKQ